MINSKHLEALIRDDPFAILIAISDGLPFIGYIPFVFEARSSAAVLLGHVANANPQWRQLVSRQAESGELNSVAVAYFMQRNLTDES